MAKFGNTSVKNLSECHPDLQRLFNEVIKHYDCSVIEGHRSEKEQNLLYEKNMTQLKYPYSKHNPIPSRAADVVPYPIDWNNTKRFYHFAGFVKGIAASLNIEIIWGGDWNNDNNLDNQSFFDLPHFELK